MVILVRIADLAGRKVHGERLESDKLYCIRSLQVGGCGFQDRGLITSSFRDVKLELMTLVALRAVIPSMALPAPVQQMQT